jgi:hypothetical protein
MDIDKVETINNEQREYKGYKGSLEDIFECFNRYIRPNKLIPSWQVTRV